MEKKLMEIFQVMLRSLKNHGTYHLFKEVCSTHNPFEYLANQYVKHALEYANRDLNWSIHLKCKFWGVNVHEWLDCTNYKWIKDNTYNLAFVLIGCMLNEFGYFSREKSGIFYDTIIELEREFLEEKCRLNEV